MTNEDWDRVATTILDVAGRVRTDMFFEVKREKVEPVDLTWVYGRKRSDPRGFCGSAMIPTNNMVGLDQDGVANIAVASVHRIGNAFEAEEARQYKPRIKTVHLFTPPKGGL